MRDNKGFTLIELLIVVVIIGILAAIAIPKFGATREKAFYSAMKSDLRNLASQQEIYYSDHYMYTTAEADLGFVESEGVAVTVSAAGPSGFSAQATHTGISTAGPHCSTVHGTGAAAVATGGGSTPTAGEIACDDG